MTLIDPLGKTKWVFIAIVVIVGIVVGGGVLLMSFQPFEVPRDLVQIPGSKPSQQVSTEELSTEGWQTYRNDEFGFEVRYPLNLLLEAPHKC